MDAYTPQGVTPAAVAPVSRLPIARFPGRPGALDVQAGDTVTYTDTGGVLVPGLTTSMTWLSWVKAPLLPAEYRRIFNYQNGTSYFELRSEKYNSNSLRWTGTDGLGHTDYAIGATGSVLTGAWRRFGVLLDRSAPILKMIIDNSFDANTAVPGYGYASAGAVLSLGHSNGGGGELLGYQALTSIYARALSTEELDYLWYYPEEVLPGCLGHWRGDLHDGKLFESIGGQYCTNTGAAEVATGFDRPHLRAD